jgi:hypothetical protein
MSALAAIREERRLVVAGLGGRAAEAAAASGVLMVVPALGECTCPHDCARDHANE